MRDEAIKDAAQSSCSNRVGNRFAMGVTVVVDEEICLGAAWEPVVIQFLRTHAGLVRPGAVVLFDVLGERRVMGGVKDEGLVHLELG